MSFFQYLRDTRGELKHVAWPTSFQTTVFTVLVIAISALVALYLGLFDYVFTTGVGELLEMLGSESTIPEGGLFPVDGDTGSETGTEAVPESAVDVEIQ
ncbi:preprotein translocase subunit SecE [Candidatus Kaiserbacteria bacterium CG10_big_fil_rev_8_21_14_0_10_59_10]|uniref:Protein translocase subunit SecE n=1 Tax=Candidatus Kaiserbacteria bacterium CG10_big_fil_rev_8_21_14_0_10_59_10 TaxID=1974612 RepID=A0A2H0U8K1_9BACT|nr:MAG: preprotein translocase subunit SecE [Candidatus Kaiserbacteria bacterium CG10_big_fil_rev_8_21_14_0_10_59_10]